MSSNNKIYYTNRTTIQKAIKRCYPDVTRAFILHNKERWYRYNPKPQPQKCVIPIPLKVEGEK